MKNFLTAAALSLCSLAATPVVSGTIGTFDFATSGSWSAIDGSSISSARGALASDGHTFIDLLSGDLTSNLASVDAVYLQWHNSTVPMTVAETDAVTDFLASGGNVIVQADHNAYDAFLGQYGISVAPAYTYETSPSNVVQPVAGVTSGLAGNVSTVSTTAFWELTLGAGGTLVVDDGWLAALGAGNGLASGSGSLYVMSDINVFDNLRISQTDNLALLRNMFEDATAPMTPVPLPASALFLPAALIGLVPFGRRRSNRRA